MSDNFKIPNIDVVTEKIDAIRLLIECCPDSPLVPIWEKALAELEAIPL